MKKTFDLDKVSSGMKAADAKNKILEQAKLDTKRKPLFELDKPTTETLATPIEEHSPNEKNSINEVLEARPKANNMPEDRAKSERSSSVVMQNNSSEVQAKSERSSSVVVKNETSVSRAKLEETSVGQIVGQSVSRAESFNQSTINYIQGINLVGVKQIKLLCLFAKSCIQNKSLESDFIPTSYLYSALGTDKESLRQMFPVLKNKGVINSFERIRAGREGLNRVILSESTFAACLRNEKLINDALSVVQSVVQSVGLRSSSINILEEKNTTTKLNYEISNQDWLESFNIKKYNDIDLAYSFELDAGLKDKLKNWGTTELELLTTLIAFGKDNNSRKNKVSMNVLFGCLRNNNKYNSEYRNESEIKAKRLLGLTPIQYIKDDTVAPKDDEISMKISYFMRDRKTELEKIKTEISTNEPNLSELEIMVRTMEVVKNKIINN